MPWDFWLIFVVLGVVLPWRGRLRVKKLLASPNVDAAERLSLYASTIAFQWVAAAVTGWRAWARGLTARDLGLAIHGGGRLLLAAVTGAVILASLQWLNLRRIGRSSGKVRTMMEALAKHLLPQSKMELLPYFALAATAGLCEEFLYRGFAMAALTRAGLPAWSVVVASSILFGLAHLYQGAGGFVGTLVIGTVFGVGRMECDGLAPVVLWHAAIDVVAGVAGPRYLVKREGPAPTAAEEGPKQL
jgi:uncharacterized protein